MELLEPLKFVQNVDNDQVVQQREHAEHAFVLFRGLCRVLYGTVKCAYLLLLLTCSLLCDSAPNRIIMLVDDILLGKSSLAIDGRGDVTML